MDLDGEGVGFTGSRMYFSQTHQVYRVFAVK